MVSHLQAQTADLQQPRVEIEVAGLKAENAALGEQLRRLEEQQRTLLEMISGLQRRLDAVAAPIPQSLPEPSIQPAIFTPSNIRLLAAADPGLVEPAPAARPLPSAVQPTPPEAMPPRGTRYDNGYVIVETADDSKFPFQVKLNNTTQFRYTNTQPTSDTFTDHLGAQHTVAARNDFSFNRDLLMFNGYAFDKRLKFSLITWSSNSLATVVFGGSLGFEFGKAMTLNAGYWGILGSRSLTATFPYFTHIERSLADNFFRPSFTQGIWALGEPIKTFHYWAFMGNGLNTLTIPTGKIDTSLVYAGSVWWEPNGVYGMYDDYLGAATPLIRVGTSFTRSREDRFTNSDQNNPENTALFNSDGVNTFATGAFAPGLTLEEATYRMWAIDGGLKWRGLAANGQYYMRRLDDFQSDGPLPLASTFDHGFELSVGQFVMPKKLELIGRTSYVFGEFGDSHEWAGGFKWFPLNTVHLWINGELVRVTKSSFGSIISPYNAGLDGWAPLAQVMFTF